MIYCNNCLKELEKRVDYKTYSFEDKEVVYCNKCWKKFELLMQKFHNALRLTKLENIEIKRKDKE